MLRDPEAAMRVPVSLWFALGAGVVGAVGCGRVGLDAPTGLAGSNGSGGGAGTAVSGSAGASSAGVTGSEGDGGQNGGAGVFGRAPALHRPGGLICPPRDVPDNLCAFPTRTPDAPDACLSNADCVENGRSGTCTSTAGMTACQCSYDLCTSDGDCHGGACLCESLFIGNVCVGGGCRVDADCGVGGFCSPNPNLCGGLGDLQCHTPRDQCLDDADCLPSQLCGFEPTIKAWKCQFPAACLP
jgi:hypothetical protein